MPATEASANPTEPARRVTERSALAALHVLIVVECFFLAWFAGQPLWDVRGTLSSWEGWSHVYSCTLSNLDVLLLGLTKGGVFLVLATLAPGARHRRPAAPLTSKCHDRLCLGVRVTRICTQLLLLAKATAVSIGAPDDVWPPLDPDPAGTPFVGLANMFASILCCLLAAPMQGWLARAVVRARQRRYEAVGEGVESVDGPGKPPANSQGSEQDEEAGGHSLLEPLLAAALQQEPDGTHPTTTTTAINNNTNKSASVAAPSAPRGGPAASAPVNPKTVSQLLKLSLPDLHINCVAFLCGSIAALALALVPYYTGKVIDYASIEPDVAKFRSTIVALIAAAALCGVFSGLRGGLFTVSMACLNVRLRRQLFHALLQMEMAFYDKNKTGEITSRLSTDTTSVSDQVSLNINVLMRSVTQAALVLMFMVAASWRLTTVTLIIVPLVMALSEVYGEYFAALSKKVQEELASANSVAEEVVSSMATVKTHAAQASSDAAYADKLAAYTRLKVREAAAYAGYACLNIFLPKAVSALVLLYGGLLVLDGRMSPGSLISFMLYQLSLSDAFEAVGDVFRAFTASVGTADKVLELMHRKPEVSGGGTLIPESLSGRIDFHNVMFHYPSRPDTPVLKGLSLTVTPGEVVALVGPSGGGKSSIVKLIERFYLPVAGSVLLDGRDIGEYDNRWLRRQVALVSQEPVLYARSVRRNIMYGLEEVDGVERPPSAEEVEEAARQANAHDFIMGLPDGYDTCCGEKGSQLSGGQKQRIAIARALVRKPKVLLLDEATSALDADSEAIVQEALDRLMEGRTVLVIAHRLSTVQHANKIVVIARGRVQEVGTHQELLEHGHTYASLVRRQLTRADSTMLSPLGSRTTSLALLSDGNTAGTLGGACSSGWVASSKVFSGGAGLVLRPQGSGGPGCPGESQGQGQGQGQGDLQLRPVQSRLRLAQASATHPTHPHGSPSND